MRLLVTGALGCDERCIAELQALGHELLVAEDERGPLPAGALDAEGVVCNGLFLHHEVASFPNLRFVQLTSAGLDRVPVAEFTERGVALFNAKGVYSVPLAEWVVMQLLNVYKRARFFDRNQQERRWEKARDLRELTGRTACIVGFGDVGREVAKRLQAFGVRVIGVDLQPADLPLADRVVGIDMLAEVLPEADFVVLTVPLTPDTRHLLDDETIAVMKQDAVLVNVSRGAVVDEDALMRALDAGKFLGVALDAFENEPLDANSALWGYERVLVTQRNSFVADQTTERLRRLVIRNTKKTEQPNLRSDLDMIRVSSPTHQPDPGAARPAAAPTLEVLVATVDQHDSSLISRMNLRTSAIILNQAACFGRAVISTEHGDIEYITVPQRGVGRNRNMALIHSKADICLFADDDVTYFDDYSVAIQKAFAAHLDAGVIIFNFDPVNTLRPHTPIKHVHQVGFHNALRYATYQIAVRREVILRHNIFFSLIFGGGADYSAGEDSMFLADCLRKGIKIVAVPETLGVVDMRSSSWFTGFHSKYLFDKGVFFAALSRTGAVPLALQFALRHHNLFRDEYSRPRMIRIMLKGIRHFRRVT